MLGTCWPRSNMILMCGGTSEIKEPVERSTDTFSLNEFNDLTVTLHQGNQEVLGEEE